MEMEREDKWSYDREFHEFNLQFHNRNITLPANFDLKLCVKEVFADIPKFDHQLRFERIGNPTNHVGLSNFPKFSIDEVLNIEQASSQAKERLKQAFQNCLGPSLILKKGTKDASEVLQDKILSRSVQEHRSKEILQQICNMELPQELAHEITGQKLWHLPQPALSLEFDTCGTKLEQQLLGSEAFCREINQKLKNTEGTDKTIRMLASAMFSSALLLTDSSSSASMEGLAGDAPSKRLPDSKLVRHSVKVEDVLSLNQLHDQLHSEVHILEAPLNNMKSICRSDSRLTGLPKLAHLVRLDLAHNQLTTYQELDGASLLQLNLSSNCLVATSPVSLPNLLTLNLSNNQITSLEHLGALPAIRHLDLSGNSIESLEGIQHLRWLETLDCSRNKISSLDGLFDGNHPLLQNVIMYGNQIDSVGQEIASITLQELQLADNKLTSFDFKIVAPLLRIVNFKGNPIHGLTLTPRWLIPAIKSLNISYTDLDDKDLVKLLQLCPNLVEIECFFTDQQKTRHVETHLSKMLGVCYSTGHSLRINNQLHHAISDISAFPFAWLPRGLPEASLLQHPAFSRYKLSLSLVEEHKRAAASEFVSKIQPNLTRVQLNLDKFIKIADYSQGLAYLELFRAFKSLAPLKVSLPDLFLSKTNFEKQARLSINKVCKFLRKVIHRIRLRREHFESNIPRIILIQKVFKGHSVRKRYNSKSNLLLKHQRNLAMVIKCQKLIRGFIIRRRFNRFFGKVREDDADIDLGGINLREFDDLKAETPEDDFFSEIQQMINLGLKEHTSNMSTADTLESESKDSKNPAILAGSSKKKPDKPSQKQGEAEAAVEQIGSQPPPNEGSRLVTQQGGAPSQHKQQKPQISIKAHPGLIQRHAPVPQQGQQKATPSIPKSVPFGGGQQKPPSSTVSSQSSTSSRLFGIKSHASSSSHDADTHSLSQYSVDSNTPSAFQKKPNKLPVGLLLIQPIGQAIQDVYEGLGCKDETVKFAIEMKLKRDMMRKKKLQKLSAAERLENFQKNSLRGG